MEEKIKFWRTNTMRSASSISKIKVKYNIPPSIGEYSETKVKSRINEILTSFSNYNQNSKSTAAKLIKKENLKNAKESVIISLREDLEYHKKINKHYLLYKQYTSDICNYYKQNFDEIFKFKSDLCDDLRDFIKVVDKYEGQINQCNKERETMIKTNNDIIRYKNEEKQKLNDKINVLNYDLEKQKLKLDKVNSTLNEYQSQNDNYINKLNSTELKYMEKFENLQDKYKSLKTQYEIYFNMELKKRKMELDFKNNNLCKDEQDKVNLKLQDKILKNIFLKEIIDEIKKQINEIESVNHRSAEDEQMLRFLGKSFYNKFKQRKADRSSKKENKDKSKSKSKIYLATDKSRSKSKGKSKSNGKFHTMKKKFGLNLLVSNNNTQQYFKNKNKNNAINTYSNTSYNINAYGNNFKDTYFTTYKNTKNKINSTSAGSN